MITGAKDFTRGAIFGPLVKLAMPIVTVNFVQMVYYLADMAWIGRLGSEQVAAVGAVGMLMWMFSSFALFTKVASEVSIGQALGARKNRTAKAFASHTTTLSLIMAIVVAVFLFAAADWILSFFKLSPYTQAYAVQYLRIVSLSVPFSFLVLNFVGVYNGAGRSNIPFLIVCSGLALNIVLSPILIYGVPGFFAGMGIQGAGIATVVAQAVVLFLLIYRLRRNDGILDRFPFLIRLRGGATVRILRLGFPVAMMTLLFAIINSYLVRVASIYGGHLGVVAKTTGGQIEGITWITAQGFSTALGAFVAQNFAAGKMSRAWLAYRYTLGLMLSLGILVTVAFLFAGEQIFGVIVPERDAAMIGGRFLFIAAFYQVFMMLELTTQGMFNGTGRTMPPAVISIIFNLARIPMAYLFASWMGIEGVWWAIAISGMIKGIVLPIWLLERSTIKTQPSQR